MIFISHRGIGENCPYQESTKKAFEFHFKRNRGVEFDIAFTQDFVPVIWHDKTLERLVNLNIQIKDLKYQQLKEVAPKICSLEEFLSIMKAHKLNKDIKNAMHIKGLFQTDTYLPCIADILNNMDEDLFVNLILFDLKPWASRLLKNSNCKIPIYASVAHPDDVQRYNSCVDETLLTYADFLLNIDSFDGAWLDEWDMESISYPKPFYTKELIEDLKDRAKGVALVTPELHSTSPGLLGSECHSDGNSLEKLKSKVKEIIFMNPDIICTDYSELFEGMV